MSEDEEYIRSLPEDRLEMLEPELRKWRCCIEGCDRFSRIKDFGISPIYRWRKKWFDVTHTVLYCGKHWKYFKRVPEKLTYKPVRGLELVTPND
jgi:hypothetical protein